MKTISRKYKQKKTLNLTLEPMKIIATVRPRCSTGYHATESELTHAITGPCRNPIKMRVIISPVASPAADKKKRKLVKFQQTMLANKFIHRIRLRSVLEQQLWPEVLFPISWCIWVHTFAPKFHLEFHSLHCQRKMMTIWCPVILVTTRNELEHLQSMGLVCEFRIGQCDANEFDAPNSQWFRFVTVKKWSDRSIHRWNRLNHAVFPYLECTPFALKPMKMILAANKIFRVVETVRNLKCTVVAAEGCF